VGSSIPLLLIVTMLGPAFPGVCSACGSSHSFGARCTGDPRGSGFLPGTSGGSRPRWGGFPPRAGRTRGDHRSQRIHDRNHALQCDHRDLSPRTRGRSRWRGRRDSRGFRRTRSPAGESRGPSKNIRLFRELTVVDNVANRAPCPRATVPGMGRRRRRCSRTGAFYERERRSREQD